MPQLDISTYTPQIFWLIIIFSVMFGVFLGLILPKLSRIFQKRFDTLSHADQQIEKLNEATLQLQKTYEEQRETAIRESQLYIDETLSSVRDAYESKLQSLEKEIQQELQYLQHTHHQQQSDFTDTYKEIIDEAVSKLLEKLGAKRES
ncbi:MAG: hypothetical protein ACK4V2_04605 [Pseudomonadota bacterium]|jgi:F-type H+-transporting ATPase subunit b|nr:hypothetical protein [Alphaproteobacteria bacterium]